MILSVHQPQYLPYSGFFDKIAKSDVFVFLDDFQYKKREFQNRNRVRTGSGGQWLTVPVIAGGKYFQKINEVKIDNSARWQKKHWAAIRQNYSKADYFCDFSGFFENLYAKEWTKLVDLNTEIIYYLLQTFDIKAEILIESALEINSNKTERLIDLCKKLGADTYLSGAGGRDYMEESRFAEEKIKLIYQDFKHPVYKQMYMKDKADFLPYLSAIDLLFNCGENSRNFFKERQL